MSIIVDALERVQSERKHSKNYDTVRKTERVNPKSQRDQNYDPAFEPGHVTSGLDHYGKQTKDISAPTSNFNFKTKLVIGILITVLAINIYLSSNISQETQPSQSFEQPETTPLPRVKTIQEENNNDLIKQHSNILQLEKGLTNIEPISNLANIEEQIESLNDETQDFNNDFLIQSDEEFFAEFEEDTIEVQAEIKQLKNEIDTILVENNAFNLATFPPIHLKAPDWIMAGKKSYYDNKFETATSIWSDGFSSLPTKTIAISIMINHVSRLAKNTLDVLFKNNIDAFIVQGLFRGKRAYFTLALLPEINELSLLTNIEQQTLSKPYKTPKSLIQRRINKLKEQIINPSLGKNSSTTTFKPIAKSKPLSNEKRLKLAQEAVFNGDYREAILKLRPILFNDKNNWEVLFWIGSAKLGLGLYNEANDYFKKATAINSDVPQLWTQRAIISQENNNHEGALKFLYRAQSLSPNSPEIILNIAYSNDALGDTNGAVFAYREFLSLTRRNSLFTQQRQAVNIRLEQLGF